MYCSSSSHLPDVVVTVKSQLSQAIRAPHVCRKRGLLWHMCFLHLEILGPFFLLICEALVSLNAP